jgi:hypothetical protein
MSMMLFLWIRMLQWNMSRHQIRVQLQLLRGQIKMVLLYLFFFLDPIEEAAKSIVFSRGLIPFFNLSFITLIRG